MKLFYDVVLLNEMTGWSGHGEDVIGDPAEKHDGGGWNKMILLLLVSIVDKDIIEYRHKDEDLRGESQRPELKLQPHQEEKRPRMAC